MSSMVSGDQINGPSCSTLIFGHLLVAFVLATVIASSLALLAANDA